MNARPLAALAAAASIAAPLPAAAAKVCAWQIPVRMVDSVSSASARTGGTFRFRTTIPVRLDNGLNIPSGTLGYGLIRSASAAGRHNHDGSLALEPRYLVVGKKKRIAVTMTPTLPVVWTPSEPLLQKAASHVPLPIPGLVMTGVNTIRYGRNITLGPGFTFSILPVENLSNGPIC